MMMVQLIGAHLPVQMPLSLGHVWWLESEIFVSRSGFQNEKTQRELLVKFPSPEDFRQPLDAGFEVPAKRARGQTETFRRQILRHGWFKIRRLESTKKFLVTWVEAQRAGRLEHHAAQGLRIRWSITGPF
jgi:hypothetical protein